MGAHVARLVGVEVRLGGEKVLDGVDLTVERGRQVAVLGRSGAGKSTLLRVLDGEITPSEGIVELTASSGEQRQAVVYQQALLLDWLTVRENVALGLGFQRNRGIEPGRIDMLLELLEIAHLADRYPDQLSGGQAQRVSLGRALAVRPELLLLDEPFSALDPATRGTLQGWLREETRREGLTSVLVTHDIDEALRLSDEIVLLESGRVLRRWDVDPGSRDEQRAEIRAAFAVDDGASSDADSTEETLTHV